MKNIEEKTEKKEKLDVISDLEHTTEVLKDYNVIGFMFIVGAIGFMTYNCITDPSSRKFTYNHFFNPKGNENYDPFCQSFHYDSKECWHYDLKEARHNRVYANQQNLKDYCKEVKIK